MREGSYMSVLAVVAVVTLLVDVLGVGDMAGRSYCSVRHPVEALTSSRTACERQHVLQRQGGGGDKANTIWINNP